MTFAGAGRDRMCIRNAGDTVSAAFIVYANGSDANCMVQGRYQAIDRPAVLKAEGDACQIRITGDLKREIRLGSLDPSCAYYCGPGADFSGKVFRRTPSPQPVTDLAGDPLC